MSQPENTTTILPDVPPELQTDSLEPLYDLNHDKFFQIVFQLKSLAIAFLKQVLPKKIVEQIDLDTLTIERRHQISELFRGTIPDFVYRVPIRGRDTFVDFFIVLEHKSADSFWTILQVWFYVVVICQREYNKAKEEGRLNANYRLPPVIAIIFHSGETRFKGFLEVNDTIAMIDGYEEYAPRMKAILYDLNMTGYDEIASDENVPELLFSLTIMKAVFDKNVFQKTKEAIAEYKKYTTNPLKIRLMRTVAVYIYQNAKALRKLGESDLFLNMYKNEIGEQNMSTMVEYWLEKGEAKGEAKGKAEGKAEGKADTIVLQLNSKFGFIPEELENRINQITDIDRLNQLAKSILSCQSLEEFEKELGS